MADEIERPLTLREAAQRSGRHINTITRWVYSGQLKTVAPPMGSKRGRYCTILDLERACTMRLVKFKQPRRPHLARKREADRERWQTKYAGTEKMRLYKQEYKRYYQTTPQYKAWRKEYMKKRAAKKRAPK